jgi:hypothetical protein
MNTKNTGYLIELQEAVEMAAWNYRTAKEHTGLFDNVCARNEAKDAMQRAINALSAEVDRIAQIAWEHPRESDQ